MKANVGSPKEGWLNPYGTCRTGMTIMQWGRLDAQNPHIGSRNPGRSWKKSMREKGAKQFCIAHGMHVLKENRYAYELRDWHSTPQIKEFD